MSIEYKTLKQCSDLAYNLVFNTPNDVKKYIKKLEKENKLLKEENEMLSKALKIKKERIEL